MDQLYVLGTGNAQATNCYNTCFSLYNGDEYFLIDTGGGNGILKILNDMAIPYSKLHHIFITHEHTDHILGIIWIIRMVAAAMRKDSYEGTLSIYCHEGLIDTIDTISRLTLQGKFYQMIGDRIFLIPVQDGETRKILTYDVTFFDIRSTKAKQYGFTTILDSGKKLAFTGDEPYNPDCRRYVENAGWLFHEAFCLFTDKDIFQPYEKHHCTVKDSCQLAEKLQVENLVLWHTEDKNIAARKEAYTQEGRQFYSGNLFIPDDKEIIRLI